MCNGLIDLTVGFERLQSPPIASLPLLDEDENKRPDHTLRPSGRVDYEENVDKGYK